MKELRRRFTWYTVVMIMSLVCFVFGMEHTIHSSSGWTFLVLQLILQIGLAVLAFGVSRVLHAGLTRSLLYASLHIVPPMVPLIYMLIYVDRMRIERTNPEQTTEVNVEGKIMRIEGFFRRIVGRSAR